MTRKITFAALFFSFLLSLALPAQLRKTTETLGVNFQGHRFSSNGLDRDYYAVAIPLRVSYTPDRYTALTLAFNHGYQSYDGVGLYGVGNLTAGLRRMFGESFSLQVQGVFPTGTRELEPLKLGTTSAGKIPYINAPLTYANQGFGGKGGFAFARQASESFKLALGASYTYRGSYTPVLGGGDFDPSDEIQLSAGLEIGDREGGLIGDVRYSIYDSEKSGDVEIAAPGDAIVVSGQIFLNTLQLSGLYYDRVATQFPFGGEFKSPMVINARLAFRLGSRVFIPYVGYEHNGDGDRILAADVLLVGGYFSNFTPGGFPFTPYLEIKYGDVGPDASMLGFRVGTAWSFQMYP